jgi:nucleoside-diphosphate-sugar epimerase
MITLVTGAGGLLGSHVTDLLADRGGRTRVLVRGNQTIDNRDPGVEVFHGDMTDRASLEAAVVGVGRVIHCAARTGPWGPTAEYQRTNVEGLGSLIEASMAAGVRRIVHVSSISVHGNDLGGPADEMAPFRPGPDPYSRSKVAAEHLVEHLVRNRNAPVTIVRPGLIYGPRDTASFGRFAAMIESGRMVILGRGSNHLPLIYARDAALGVVLASECADASGQAFVLVNDEPVTQFDYLSRIAMGLGVAGPRRRIPYPLAMAIATMAEAGTRLLGREQPPPLTRFGVQLMAGENRFSIRRAGEQLGFIPQVDLEEGVRRSLEWYRAMPHQAARRAA